MSLLAGHRDRDIDIENGHVDTTRERESERNWERWVDIYTLLCVELIASVKLLHSTRSSAWCSLMTQMGAMGEGRVEGGP